MSPLKIKKGSNKHSAYNLRPSFSDVIDAEIFTRGSSARDFLLSENLGGATHDWFASTSGYDASFSGALGVNMKF